jgi:acetyl-CoA synthetase
LVLRSHKHQPKRTKVFWFFFSKKNVLSMTSFAEARAFLLAHRTDYAAAMAGFRWPDEAQFNWALDWFDAVLARGDLADAPALRITGEGAATLTFAELSARSNRVANGLRELGVRRGDRVLLMLGNVVPLWEVMLAAMKLGAVVIPATTLLTPADLQDRIARGRVSVLVASAGDAAKFSALADGVARIAVGGAVDGWHDYAVVAEGAEAFVPDGPTNAADPLLLYFTSGTTARPKLVLHSHRSYPVGHLSTL